MLIKKKTHINQSQGLDAEGLTISRAEQVLLENVSFSLQPQSITHLYGENGAGKTSLMRTLAGLLPADNGQISWQSKSINAADSTYRQQLLFLAHALAMKSELSIFQNLTFYSRLRGVKLNREQIENACQVLGLASLLDRPFAELSAGQQHKVCLCRLQLEPSSIWILDEPFVNLDQATRVWLAKTIESFAKDGGVVLFTSHQDIEELSINQKISLENNPDAKEGD